MPTKKYKKYGRGRKRRYYRKRKRRYNTMISTRAPVTRQYLTKLKYSTLININPTSGLVGTHTFSMNGIHDPDISGSGHRPMGSSQLSGLYDHYTVIGSKITAAFMPASGEYVVCGIMIDDSNTFATGFDGVCEQSESNFTVAVGGEPVRRVTRKLNPLKYLGKRLTDSEVQGEFGVANPSEGVYAHVFVKGKNASVDISGVDVLVNIEYIVMCREPKELAES